MTATTMGNTMGALLLGTFGSVMLYGALVVQGYFYFGRYPGDRWFQKVAVGTLILVATLNVIFSMYTIYHYLIESFGDTEALSLVVWSFKLQQGWDILTIIAVQCLYTLRVWKLGRHIHKLWPVVVALVVAGGTAAGLALFVGICRMKSFVDLESIKGVIYASLGTVVLTDIVIATAICYYLQQSRSGLAPTNNRLLKVMQYVLACGFLTSTCSVLALVTFGSTSNNLIFASIDFIMCKLYINSYLALLNARKSISDDDSAVTVSKVFHLQTTRRGQTETSQFGTDEENTKNTGVSLVEQPKIDITVHHVVDQQHDSPSMLHTTRNVV